MEEEEDANKATNHEVFLDDIFPIAWRAAATEFLIKTHKFVLCERRVGCLPGYREGTGGEWSPEGTGH